MSTAHSINRVTLTGQIVEGPRMSDSGACTVIIETAEKGRDVRDRHALVAFGRFAQSMSQFWKQGYTVYAEGSLRNRAHGDHGDSVIYLTNGFIINNH